MNVKIEKLATHSGIKFSNLRGVARESSHEDEDSSGSFPIREHRSTVKNVR